MKTLNKSLLAAAVIGAIALPGLSSAATVQYVAGKQLTFARDLIVSNSVPSIVVPDGLRVAAVASDAVNVATVVASPPQALTVKITLTNGALFAGAPNTAPAIVKTFVEGAQTGGDGVSSFLTVGNAAQLALIDSTAHYTPDRSELIFDYYPTANGNTGPGFWLEINGFNISNLMQSLGSLGNVRAEVTVQNAASQAIFAGGAVVARSKWGVNLSTLPQPVAEQNKRIDVGSMPLSKAHYSPSGVVGESRTPAFTGALIAGHDYFNAGGFKLFIEKDALTGAGTDYVNNFNANSSNPHFNVINNSTVVVTVTGSDLNAFTTGQVWLDRSSTCAHAGGTNSVDASSVNATQAVFSVSTTTGFWDTPGVATPSPSDSDVYVCFGLPTGANQLVAQGLSGQVRVQYPVPTQRVNPDPWGFDLAPLQYNGAVVYFQNVNPGGNTTAESFLRFTNHNATPCAVVVDAKDDLGRYGGPVRVTGIAGHASENFNINILESGVDPRFSSGSLRDGAGKWYVRVTAECANFTASALNRHTDGVVTDLTPQRGFQVQWSHDPANLVP